MHTHAETARQEKTSSGTFASFLLYADEFYTFARGRLPWLLAIVCASAALEGLSLVMIIPFLHAAGMSGTAAKALTVNGPLLLSLLGLYVVLVIVQEYLKRCTTIETTSLKAGFCRSLSDRFYEAFARARWQALVSQKRADIGNALTNELKTIDMGTQVSVQTLITIPAALIQVVISFVISPPVTLAALLLGFLFYLFMRPVNRKLGNIAEALNGVLNDSFTTVNEHLGGIKEIKSYGAEQVHLDRFARKNRETEQKFVQFIATFSTSSFIYNSVTMLVLVAFIYCAVALFHVDTARLVVLFLIFMRIWPILSSLQTSLQFFLLMLPAWQSFSGQMKELSLAREASPAAPDAGSFGLQQAVEVKNLTFSYGDHEKKVINTLNLTIPAHSLVAVTGLSGSGKSTLIDLLLGLLEPAQGEILVDGVKLDSSTVPSWRRSVGFVPQDTFLFNGTVRENLLWSRPDATDDELWEALRLSAADEFVRELPDGLDTCCGDRGTRFSGGQRQRIALARALLRAPALLILDEATSALDSENEKKIHEAIRSLHGKMTILVVAHRLSTIRDADEIVVLEEGAIREQGTFTALAEKKEGRFQELSREYSMN